MKTAWSKSFLLISILLSGCRAPATTERSQPIPAKPVSLVSISERTATSGEHFAALLAPNSETALSFRVPGYVTSIYQSRSQAGAVHEIEPGDPVPAGAVLARIRSSEYVATSDQRSDAAMEATAVVRAAASRLEEAQARAKNAESDFTRMSTLWSQASATQPAYDAALAQRDGARASVSALEANLVAARRHADSLTAQSRETQIALADTALIAPYAAVMVSRHIERGSLVQSGTEVMMIADMRRMKVRLNVPDAVATNISQNRAFSVTISAFPNKLFSGKVLSIAREADVRSRAFAIELLLDNKAGLLRSGMIASVTLPGQSKEPGMTVPSSALVHDPVSGSYKVFVADTENGSLIARTHTVEIGDISGGSVTLARATFDRNARVVADGAMLLKDGDRIEDQGDDHARNAQEVKK